MSSISSYIWSAGWDDERRLDKAHPELPVAQNTLIVEAGACSGFEPELAQSEENVA